MTQAQKMSLDAFVNTAVTTVRGARVKGKKGAVARKKLGEAQSQFEKTKEELRNLARQAQRNEWRPTRLIMLQFQGTCRCGACTPSCVEAVYLEESHRRNGTLQTRIDSFRPHLYASLPRDIEVRPIENYVCPDCFLSHNPAQELLDFPVPKKNWRPAREEGILYQKFMEASTLYDIQEKNRWIKKYLRTFMPQVPLLTFKPEII